MLIRIVRMHFTENGAKNFIAIFRRNQHAIRNFEGCTHLELVTDLDNPLTYATISNWKDQTSLENYRKSELFAGVWNEVKPLFSSRAEAFSFEAIP